MSFVVIKLGSQIVYGNMGQNNSELDIRSESLTFAAATESCGPYNKGLTLVQLSPSLFLKVYEWSAQMDGTAACMQVIQTETFQMGAYDTVYNGLKSEPTCRRSETTCR